MFRILFNRFLSSRQTLDFSSWPMDVSTPPHWLICHDKRPCQKKKQQQEPRRTSSLLQGKNSL